MQTINVQKRVPGRENLKVLLQNKIVPGVINRPQMESTPIMIQMNVLKRLQQKKNEVIKLKGLDSEKEAMLTEVQVDPVTRMPIHFNLRTFDESLKSKVVEREVPLNFTGNPSWLGTSYKAIKPLKTILLAGTLKDMPNSFTIDMSKFTPDKVLHVSDLKLPKGTSIPQSEKDKVILTFQKSRVAEEKDEEASSEVV